MAKQPEFIKNKLSLGLSIKHKYFILKNNDLEHFHLENSIKKYFGVWDAFNWTADTHQES